jgi:hypothetical protein
MKTANYLGLSFQFWTLVINTISEMEKTENKKSLMSKYIPNETFKESYKRYFEKTKWNDFNIGVPILFNFYHGLELIMKGLLQEVEKLPDGKKTHKLTDYYNIIQQNEKIFSKGIIISIQNVLKENGRFSDFFESNKSNVDQFYLILRYPESSKGNINYTHNEIRGKEKIGLKNFLFVKESCEKINNEINEWFKRREINE